MSGERYDRDGNLVHEEHIGDAMKTEEVGDGKWMEETCERCGKPIYAGQTENPPPGSCECSPEDDPSFCEWCQTSVPGDDHPDHCPVQGELVLRNMLNPAFLEEFARRLLDTLTVQALLGEVLDAFKTPAIRPGVKTGVPKGGLEVPSLPSFNVNVKGKECNEGNVKTPRGVGVLKSHLLPEVKTILEAAEVDSDLIRYMDVMTGYSHVLNNPKSGDLNDAPRLLRSFVSKEGFATRYAQWLKNNPAPPAPYDPETNPLDPDI